VKKQQHRDNLMTIINMVKGQHGEIINGMSLFRACRLADNPAGLKGAKNA
jgi:hypothetical protein